MSETGQRGAEPKHGPVHTTRIRALLNRPPLEGYSNWTASLTARKLMNIHRTFGGSCAPKRSTFRGASHGARARTQSLLKAADIVGLYMNPPENAIVLLMDEKPPIQALERGQGYPKLPNGWAMTGQSYDYKCNGTTTYSLASLPDLHSDPAMNQIGRCDRLLSSEMARKRMTKRPTAYEHFLYLLGEMERVVDSGHIRWPARQTRTIQNRLTQIVQNVTAQASKRPKEETHPG
ncbi:MAG: hypothetical protein AB7F35_26285 [Acetobacteraceae bacterium]